MSVTKQFRGIILLTTCIPVLQVYTQPADTVLQNITIATKAIVEASNSITAGPNFTVAGNGDATLRTGGYIYFKRAIAIIQGSRLRTIYDPSLVGVRTLEATKLDNFALEQNYPNPFNPETNIRFAIKQKSHVSLIVYSLLGQQVATLVNEDLPAGKYEATFTRNGLASGAYVYRMSTNGFIESRRMLLVK